MLISHIYMHVPAVDAGIYRISYGCLVALSDKPVSTLWFLVYQVFVLKRICNKQNYHKEFLEVSFISRTIQPFEKLFALYTHTTIWNEKVWANQFFQPRRNQEQSYHTLFQSPLARQVHIEALSYQVKTTVSSALTRDVRGMMAVCEWE